MNSAAAASFCVLLLLLAGCGDDAAQTSTTAGSGAASGSGGSSATGGAGGGATCLSCGAPESQGSPANPAIVEASGIARSRDHAGSFYAHNDSGDTARFFAIGAQGQDLGSYRLPGVTAIDWEDMARGPCADPQKSCLYFADFGDNNKVRTSYAIYRVEEPAALSVGEHDVAFETFSFQYSDGAHNAETLLVHPQTGEITIVTKDGGGSQAFSWAPPFDRVKSTTLTNPSPVLVLDLLPLVTGGDIHPAAEGVLLRSYTGVWLYPMAAGEAAAAALARTPCMLVAPSEQQGEAVTWLADGKSYVTLSEGAAAELNLVSCNR